MTEKVLFEFRVLNEPDEVKYEIHQGTEKYICSGHVVPRCIPLPFTSCSKPLSKMHRKLIHRSQKRVRKTLDTLENLYADFYGNKKPPTETDPS